jgi:allophanate hydrolase subunit 1
MFAKELDTKEATNKWWAFQDARMRNIANASHYSEQDRVRAERMKLVLELVYSATNIHINFRKTKIAIKVTSGRVKDKINLRALEADWAAAGVHKSVTSQGIIYSFS